MVTKLVRIFLVITLVTVAIAVASAAVIASNPGGTGPDDAFYPTSDWRVLNPGETHWYMFRDKGKEAQILVDLTAFDLNGIGFEVWTEGNTQTWFSGRKVTPIGRGSINTVKDDSLIWAGNFNMSGDCLVLVKNTGTTARSYNLSITGRDVYFPTFQPDQVTTRTVASPEVVVASAASAAPVAMAAIEAPMAIDGKWMAIAGNETRWFSFDYEGKNKDILIRMKEDIAGRATFAVYTPGQYADKMAGKKVDPVGRSSTDPYKSNSVFWFGSFLDKGTYYVEVIHTNQNRDCSAYCALSITSNGLVQ